MTFTERSAIEEGFAEVYERRIAPELQRLDTQRRSLRKTANMQMLLAVTLGIAAAVATLFLTENLRSGLIGAAVLVVLGGVLGKTLRDTKCETWRGGVARYVMPVVTEFIGDLSWTAYPPRDAPPLPVARMRELDLLPGHATCHLEDHLAGRWRGTAFDIAEAVLSSSRTDQDGHTGPARVFHGLIFRISLPRRAPTPILITRDFGQVGNRLAAMFGSGKGRKMPKVTLDHVTFGQHFVVYAADPEAARAYLAQRDLGALVQIGQTEADAGASGLRAAFDGEDFLLAIARDRPFMEGSGLDSPVTDAAKDLHHVFDDIAMVRHIIDRLIV